MQPLRDIINCICRDLSRHARFSFVLKLIGLNVAFVQLRSSRHVMRF